MIINGDKMNYIMRGTKGILISSNKGITTINSGIIQYLDILCINQLSTYKGRLLSVKKKYNIKRNIPLFIHEQLLLIPLKSIQEYDSCLINFHHILLVEGNKERTKITFLDGTILHYNISANKTRKLISKCTRIVDWF